MKIAVLGRGNSLKEYKKYSHLFDKIYISGRFHKEIKKIGKEHFKNKEIIHVVARTSRPLTDKYYKKLNVKYAQTFCHFWDQFSTSYGKSHIDKYPSFIELKLIPDCMRKRGYPPLNYRVLERFCKKFDNYKEMCSFLNKNMYDDIRKNEKLIRRTRYWPTVGVYALDLALTENKNIKEIYIFGIDLYSTDSYSRYKNYEYDSVQDTPLTKLALYHLFQLVKEYNNIKFYSSCVFEKNKLKYSNWNSLKDKKSN